MSELKAILEKVAALEAALSLLAWDRAVFMPDAASDARAAHQARLASERHRLLTDETLWTETERLSQRPGIEGVGAQRLREEIERDRALPSEFVARRARVSAEAYGIWRTARADRDFARFAPYLAEQVRLACEMAEYLRPDGEPYDALLDLYEPEATIKDADRMFDALRAGLANLLPEGVARDAAVDDRPMRRDWDQAKLRDLAERIVAHVGFDFDRGSLHLAPNAFCASTNPLDVRMTTRPSDHVKGVLSSSLHEMGHGLYAQGEPVAWSGTPLLGGASLAVHESQSRLWENVVGRHPAFWSFFFPWLAETAPDLAAMGAEGFRRAYARVKPDPIRVGADELSYNLHILIRYELERELIAGDLATQDVPDAWNAKYERYLGFTPEHVGVGALQDVHWSKGSFGYFPTYAMGNVLGGQLWERMAEDLPEREVQMERGEFRPMLDWLTEKIYRKGASLKPRALMHEICGDYLNPDPWLRYARERYVPTSP